MNVEERVAQAKLFIRNIATKYDETDDVIHAALADIVKFAGESSATVTDKRAEAEASYAAYLKRVEDNKAAVLATTGKLPEPMNASIGLKG
jgi:hypothetical protein